MTMDNLVISTQTPRARVVSHIYDGHVFQRGQNRTLKLIMGVDTQTWRIKIGTFIHPRKCRNAMKCLFVSGKAVFLTVRGSLVFSLLLLLCGDVESNPGPPKDGRQAARVTWQSTLDSFSADRRTSVDSTRSPFTARSPEPPHS